MNPSLALGLIALLLALQAVHCFRERGRRSMLLFFGLALIYALMRELWITNHPRPFYTPGSLGVLNISPIIILGWPLHFYLALWIARRLLRVDLRAERFRMAPLALLAASAMLVLALPGEVIGSRLRWWIWQPDNLMDLGWYHGLPLNVLGGWMLTGGMFVLAFLLFEHQHPLRWANLGALAGSIPFHTLTHPYLLMGLGLLAGYVAAAAWFLPRVTPEKISLGST